MSQSEGVEFDLVQFTAYVVITPVAIRLAIKTYLELSQHRDSQTMRIDFYLFHIIMFASWAVFGFVNVYCSLGNIVLRYLASSSDQVGVLLRNGVHHCASDIVMIFLLALYAYSSILMPINWLEIASNGYVAATDVNQIVVCKALACLSLVETVFSMVSQYGGASFRPPHGSQDLSSYCSNITRVRRHTFTFGKIVIFSGFSCIAAVISMATALKTRYHIIAKPQQWKHSIAVTFDKEYYPRMIKQLSLHMVTCLWIIGHVIAYYSDTAYTLFYQNIFVFVLSRVIITVALNLYQFAL